MSPARNDCSPFVRSAVEGAFRRVSKPYRSPGDQLSGSPPQSSSPFDLGAPVHSLHRPETSVPNSANGFYWRPSAWIVSLTSTPPKHRQFRDVMPFGAEASFRPWTTGSKSRAEAPYPSHSCQIPPFCRLFFTAPDPLRHNNDCRVYLMVICENAVVFFARPAISLSNRRRTMVLRRHERRHE